MTTDKKIDDKNEGPRDFGRILALLDEGVALSQLSEDLHALTRAVQTQAQARNKAVAGTLSFTLKVSGDETGVVSVHYDIARKDPKPKRSASLFWITKGGNLTEQNPRQQSLPGLRDVSGGRPTAREVEPESAAREV